MTDLRDAIAQRLCDLTLARMGDSTPWQTSARHTKDYYRHMADECIRQMEWARTGWIASKGSNGSTFYTNANPPIPLTPAPDDWKPQQEDTP